MNFLAGSAMTRVLLIVVVLATYASGCKRNETQRKITSHLFAPFSMPDEARQRSQFLTAYRERIGVSPDSAIIRYDSNSFFFRSDEGQFSDAIAVFVYSTVNDPKRGLLSV